MRLQRINRTDPEKIYINVHNVQGTTLTASYPACFDIRNSSSLGLTVSKPATSTLALLAGVPDADIADDAIGQIQCFGVASVTVNMGAASVSCAGLGLGAINNSWSLQTVGGYPKDAAGAINSAAPYAVMLDNDVSGPNAVANAFLRAM